jgi:hypothetical protein
MLPADTVEMKVGMTLHIPVHGADLGPKALAYTTQHAEHCLGWPVPR